MLGDHERDQLILRGSEIQKALLELNFKEQIGKNHLTQDRARGLILKAEEPGKADAFGELQAFNTDGVRCLPKQKSQAAGVLCVGGEGVGSLSRRDWEINDGF